MDDKDLLIENIMDSKKPKKKVDGKAKGDRTERGLCKLLTEHFGTEFTKAPGSGSFATIRENLPEHAKKTLTGDLCVPEGFRWTIECKGGYEDDIDFTNLLDGPILRLQEFIEQCLRDSENCGRLPLICWKRNRKPWLVFIRHVDLIRSLKAPSIPQLSLPFHEGWLVVSLDKLLENSERFFWFETKLLKG